MSCDHRWVMYTPFRGEAFEVCANEGCRYTKLQFDQEVIQRYQVTDLRPNGITPGFALSVYCNPFLSKGMPSTTVSTPFGDVEVDDADLPMGRSDNAPPDTSSSWAQESKDIQTSYDDRATKAAVAAAIKYIKRKV